MVRPPERQSVQAVHDEPPGVCGGMDFAEGFVQERPHDSLDDFVTGRPSGRELREPFFELSQHRVWSVNVESEAVRLDRSLSMLDL